MAASIAFQQARTQSGGSSSYTLTFTAASAAGQERLVALCGISNGGATTVTFGSVTIDGQAATQVASYARVSDGGANGPVMSFWRAAGTSATSVNVSFTVTAAAMYDGRGVLWSLNDAGTLLDSQITTIGNPVSGDLSLNVDTVTDGVVAAAFMAYNSASHAATWIGLTERYDGTSDNLYGQDWFGAADANIASGSTPLTVTVDLPADFGSPQGAVGIALSFNPAEASTDTDGGIEGEGQQIIDIGDAINDGTGDPVRVAFDKCNHNFTELYDADTTFLTTTAAAATYQPLGAAPLASPIFTGDPQAPTPAPEDNDTSIATTAFVKSAVTAANQVFYCDLTDAADVATYKRLLLTPSTHAETSASAVCTGTTTDFLIASFITDPGVPGAIEYPAGSAYRRLYGSVSGGAARFRLQIYSRTVGGVETLARDEVSNNFTDTTATLQEWLATPTVGGALTASDRIVVKVSARRISGPTNVTVTLYSEGSAHASQVQTTITSGTSVSISATPPLALTGGNLTIDLSAYQPTPTPPQGRLTLQTATPVMTTTQSAKTTIYYTPYVGNQVPIYDGSSITMTTFAELSVATTDTTKSPAAIGASKVNDWFIWSDASTVRIGHGPDWTNDTTRSAGTALVMVRGILLNNVSITNGPAASRGTYVGTTRSNASSQLDWIFGGIAVKGTAGVFYVWNAYNRVNVATMVGDNTDSWTYNTANTWRASNAGATMRVSYVAGLAEDAVSADFICFAQSAATSNASIGIGVDSTTAFSGSVMYVATSETRILNAKYAGIPGVGAHFVSAIEFSGAAVGSIFFGDGGLIQLQNGLFAQLRM